MVTVRIQEALDNYYSLLRRMVAGRVYDPEAHKARTEVYHLTARELESRIPLIRELRQTGLYGSLITLFLDHFQDVPLNADRDEIVWGVEWQRLERPTFVVSESLMATLMLTDPGKVLTSDVPWPFPAFKITLPSPGCTIPVQTHGSTKLIRPVVTEEALRSISILQWGQYHGSADTIYPILKGDPLENVEATARVALEQRDKLSRREAVVARAFGSYGTSIYHNQHWEEGETVSDWLQFTTEHDRGERLADKDKRAILLAQRVAVNLALYLASEDEETGKPTWSPADKTTGRGKNWNVGGKVKISRDVRDAAREVAAGRAATCPAVKHIVRGHFRNQACGVGRLERKRLYIKPHWRGPDGTTPHERTYVMK